MEIIGIFNKLEDFKAWWLRTDDEEDPEDPHAEAKKRLVRIRHISIPRLTGYQLKGA